MPRSPAAGRLRRACAVVAVLALAAVLTACGRGSPSPAAIVTPSSSPAPSASATAAAATPPGVVAVTSRGALITLDPVAGNVQRTLVPSGVLGDEVSVGSTGMVYFAVKDGCSSEIEAVPIGGGTPAVLATGSFPAVSPDGTKLAYANQPSLAAHCASQGSALLQNYKLAIRTLSNGTTVTLPMAGPNCQCGGLPEPISHLSWSPDNRHIAVSVASVQDNEGWGVSLVDTSVADAYRVGTGAVNVPVTGSPDARQSYLREGVYMPNGDLFVSRACCAGYPVHNTSRLMWEVTTSGALVHQVAIGYPNLDHISLDVSGDGQWLLYLAGTTLYVSEGGATPKELTTGMIAAAWA